LLGKLEDLVNSLQFIKTKKSLLGLSPGSSFPFIGFNENRYFNKFGVDLFSQIKPQLYFDKIDSLVDLIPTIEYPLFDNILQLSSDYVIDIRHRVLVKGHYFGNEFIFQSLDKGYFSTYDYRSLLIFDDGSGDIEQKDMRKSFGLTVRDCLVITSAIILANYGIISIGRLSFWLEDKFGQRAMNKGFFFCVKGVANKVISIMFWSPPRKSIVKRITSNSRKPKRGPGKLIPFYKRE
jgi:hypothetical protein